MTRLTPTAAVVNSSCRHVHEVFATTVSSGAIGVPAARALLRDNDRYLGYRVGWGNTGATTRSGSLRLYIGTVAMIKLICWLLAAVALALSMAACGASGSVDEKGVSVNSKTYDVAGLPFTFKYPVDFQEGTDASIRGFRFAHGLVGLPGTASYILVLRNDSRREKTIAELQREAVTSGAKATMHEKHSGMPMLKAVLPDTDPRGRHGVQYAFAAGRATWLIQCVAEDAQREKIDAACKRAIDSLRSRP